MLGVQPKLTKPFGRVSLRRLMSTADFKRYILIAICTLSVNLVEQSNAEEFLNSSVPAIYEKWVLQDPDPGVQDGYGWSLAVEDAVGVVGMPGSTGGSGPSHAAYVYNLHTRQLLQTLVPISSDPQDSFGSSVAISGNLVVVGARFEDVQTSTGTRFNAGAAHVYDLRTGQHISRLIPNDPRQNAFLGDIVDIDGTNVLVGGDADAAYLFDALTGQQLAKFTPSTPASNFGASLSLDGSVAVIGASAISAAAAYVFDISTKMELRKIVPDDAAAGDGFSNDVELDGHIAAIGSIFHDGLYTNSGAVYVYDVTTGEQLAKLLPPVKPSGNTVPNFGVSVGIDDTRVVVGASGISKSFLFDWTTETAIAELLPNDFTSTVNFGWDAALDGGYALVSDLQGRLLGAAYVFPIPEPCGFMIALIGAGTLCAACRTRIVAPASMRAAIAPG